MRLGVQLYARCIPSGECLLCPHRGRAIVYGPFLSRRRGTSIGINLFPVRKVCSYNCVYCFRGETEVKTLTPVDDAIGVSRDLTAKALDEAYRVFSNEVEIKAVDFSGNGEPTLHTRFPELVDVTLRFTKTTDPSISVGVFTNSSTLWIPKVVETLRRIDYIEAKLDTVDNRKFKVVNQPAEGLHISKIVEGLRSLKRDFGGTFVVQIMLLNYIGVTNYLKEDAEAMAEVLRIVEPDKVHLYTVYRVPRLNEVEKISEEAMSSYATILESYGLHAEVYPR